MSTKRFHAAWVLPIATPPLRDGWVTVRDGRVLAIGSGTPPTTAGIETIDLGRVAIMPGLVNAHTHLELSWLWGRVAPASSFIEWVLRLIAERRAVTHDDPAAIVSAIADMEEAGTAAVGDISNSLASIAPIAASRLSAVVFRELLGFNTPDPAALIAHARAALAEVEGRLAARPASAATGAEVRATIADVDAQPPSPSASATSGASAPASGSASIPASHSAPASGSAVTRASRIRLTLAPHAPYSVSPALFRAIAADVEATGEPTTVHLGESADEVRFLRGGDGPFRDLLDRVGSWNATWQAPACAPVEYMSRLGVLSPRLLAVHCVQLQDEELRTLAAQGVTVVTCPRSNVWVGSGNPPIERFYASGVRVAIGTDSLASATDLNLFSEVALLHHLAPQVPAARLLASATLEGARALGFDDLGHIAPGTRARLIAIDLPVSVRDVETYLVEGIEPTQIAWVAANPADAAAARALPR